MDAYTEESSSRQCNRHFPTRGIILPYKRMSLTDLGLVVQQQRLQLPPL